MSIISIGTFLKTSAVVAYSFIARAFKFITRILNLVPNVQWRADLNLYQNIILNLYMPDSAGKLSMHTSLLIIFMLLIIATLVLEMNRFFTNLDYKFSDGFWILLGGLAAMVKLMFTHDAHLKMAQADDDSDDKTVTPPVPAPHPVAPAPEPHLIPPAADAEKKN
jgi:hypothetical protein